MKCIEFSEMTNRLRRNLMAAAFLIISIKAFNIKVEKVSAGGAQLENLTTEVVMLILLAFIIYHALAFAIRAFEEYRHWELTFSNVEDSTWNGDKVTESLATKLRQASPAINKLIDGDGLKVDETSEAFNAADVQNLKAVISAAQIYAKRFENFPKVTRLRFWVWDIGTACILTAVAITFAI